MLNFLKKKIHSWFRRREAFERCAKLYNNSRGQAQERRLENDFDHLENMISSKKSRVEKKERDISDLQKELRLGLKKEALLTYFKKHYDAINGVGESYSKRILRVIREKPTGDWKNFDRIAGKIIAELKGLDGIGQEKHSLVENWYNNHKQDIKILASDIRDDPEKLPQKKKELRRKKLEKKRIEKEIEELKELKDNLKQTLDRLRETTVRDFVLADINESKYSEASKRANFYLRGFYAEWEDAPGWYKKVQRVVNGDGELGHDNSQLRRKDLQNILNKTSLLDE